MHARHWFRLLTVGCALVALTYYLLVPAPREGDWQEQLAVPSVAHLAGDLVTIDNVRNFRYSPTETDMHPAYYRRTYDLSKIARVWYTTEPFNEDQFAAHTYVSFEFENGDFLAITIEARKSKGQTYSVLKGFLRSYPLMYIAADERDVTLLRANVRKDRVYVYPVKLKDPESARALLESMLTEMNRLAERPRWYHVLFSNCTSEIAKHVNRIEPGRIPLYSWQLWLTASADELALESGLLDTNVPIEQAREQFTINDISERVGDVPEYSRLIRQ